MRSDKVTKKFVIEEAWMLDDNGDKLMKLNSFDVNVSTIPSLVNEEDIKGGYGELITLAVPSKGKTRYNFASMFNYCKTINKDITELTIEEKEQFIISRKEECD